MSLWIVWTLILASCLLFWTGVISALVSLL